jgi:hypothetical protein
MLQPFLKTALPIMLSILVAAIVNNKRLDDLNRRLDKIEARLERIEAKLDGHETRIIRFEERTSPLAGIR